MSTAPPPPGWHPDPGNPNGAVRWWDGTQWTSHVQPIGSPPPSGSAFGWPGRSTRNRNQRSLTAIAAAAIYIAIDLAARGHVILVGFLPILLAIRAVRARESLAVLAVIAAAVTVAIAFGVR